MDSGSTSSARSQEYRPLFGGGGPLFNNGDAPLFGTDTRKDRYVNIIIGFITGLFVMITLITSFSIHHWSYWGLNVFFSLCIVLFGLGQLILVFWFRQGDLDPKFRNLIYINAFTLNLLCICALIYFSKARDDNFSATTLAPKL